MQAFDLRAAPLLILLAGAGGTLGTANAQALTNQPPDPQYVAFVFALARLSAGAEVIAVACDTKYDTFQQALVRIRKSKSEAQGRIFSIPNVSVQLQRRLNSADQEKIETAKLIDAGEKLPKDCKKLIDKELSVLDKVRRLVSDRERLSSKDNAN